MSEVYSKPLPAIRPWTATFWKAASEGKLLIQRGKKTGKLIMYPKKYSPHDYTEEIEWIEASGKGTIYSYSIVHANAPTAFKDELPFVVAIVELEEGVRMCTNIVDTPFEKISIGSEVTTVFKKINEEIGLVQFRVI
jgi:hypothetical protein